MTEGNKTDLPNPKGDEPGKESPNEPVSPSRGNTRRVDDPHPDTEEGYGRDSKVPTEGL